MDPQDFKVMYPEEIMDLSNKNAGVTGVAKGLKRIRPQTMCSLVDISCNVNTEESYDPRMMEMFMASLERILTENHNLRTLLTASNHMFDNSPHPNNQHLHYYLCDLADLLSTSSIVVLDVSDNNIIGYNGKQMSGFSQLCRKFLVPKAEGFVCRLNRIHSRSLFFISEALGPFSHMIYLDLSDNPLDVDGNNVRNLEGIRQLTMMINQTHTLKTLKLARCGLCDDSVVMVFNAVATMCNLQTVDMSGNYSGEIGAISMKTAIVGHGISLGEGKCLTNLNVSNNPLSTAGAVHVIESMSISNTIHSLNLSHCEIDKKPMSMFIRSLQTNIVLKSLDISMNPCPSSVITKVMSEVEANNLLVSLTHDPMSVNAMDLPGTVHDALMRKLKYLSQRTLFAMHKNSSFCLQGSRMKETLMLLRPDVRHTRIVESVEKSITMAGRMKEQAQVMTRVNAAFIIYETICAWHERMQILNKQVQNKQGQQSLAFLMRKAFHRRIKGMKRGPAL